MPEITDRLILEHIWDADQSSAFSLDDIIGKVIARHEMIKSEDTEYHALIFSDGTFLASSCFRQWGVGHMQFYYYNGEKTLYSADLFGNTQFDDKAFREAPTSEEMRP